MGGCRGVKGLGSTGEELGVPGWRARIGTGLTLSKGWVIGGGGSLFVIRRPIVRLTAVCRRGTHAS